MTAGYLYQSHLRGLVRERLGLEWGPVHNGASELAAVPELVLREFSKRRQQMQRLAAGGGIGLLSKASGQAAALATRERKRYGIQTHSWREEVRARAGELGLGEGEFKRLLREGRRRARAGERVDEALLGEHLTGPEGLTANVNVFDERAVLQAFAAAAAQGANVAVVRDQAKRFTSRPDVIVIDDERMTSAGLVACERALINAAVRRGREGCAAVEPALLEHVIGRAPWPLTAQQAAAVRIVGGSGDGVSVIQALAGTGKTYTASVLRAAYEQAGFEVIGVAPTGRAARELRDRAGIKSRTLDRLLLELQRDGWLPAGCVVILDEAGMAPTRASARLLEAAQQAGAKVVAIGDPGQLSSVKAGGWLGALGWRLGAVRLSEVMRQHDPLERRALAALHDGRPVPYLSWADAAGRISTFSDPAHTRAHALAQWAESARRFGVAEAVMIARDNHTREELNAAAREHWRALGRLGEEHTLGTLRLAVGDRVICRRNDRLVDVDNGTRATVRHIYPDRVVIDADGGLVRELPASYAQEHLEHAYALTGHGMQGATVQTAFVVASPGDLTRGWSYTALSRAREHTQLIVHDEERCDERYGYAPSERSAALGRPELVARMQKRMRESEEEHLAIEQLPRAGRRDDPQLHGARGVPHQDQAALRAERESEHQLSKVSPQELREQRERLTTKLNALPARPLEQVADLDARLSTLADQCKRAHQRLLDLTHPPQHPARPDHSDAVERAHLENAIQALEHQLQECRHRAGLVREIGESLEVHRERKALSRALTHVEREEQAVCAKLVERDLDGPSAWVQHRYGKRPDERRQQAISERRVRATGGDRLQYETTDDADLPGQRAEQRFQQQHWQPTRETLERSPRPLTRKRHPSHGIDID